jgi:transposase
LARAGELTPIYVPDIWDGAMRDLVRTREDAVMMQRQARQRLAALLLRNDVRYAGKTAWTAAHRRWKEGASAAMRPLSQTRGTRG